MEWLAMQTAAETTGELTEREMAALGIGGIFGAFAGALAVMSFIWYILSAIGYWKVLVKGGHPGWHSLIPILNAYDQYDMAWNGWMGVATSFLAGFGLALSQTAQNTQGGGVLSVIAAVCAIASLAINIIGMNKFAKAFGKGVGFTVGLVLLEPFFMMILGFGSSEYIGKPQE